MRESMRIRLRTAPRRWTAAEIQLLGKYSDMETARRLARDRSVVRRQRIALKIPAAAPRPRFENWTHEQDKLLGTLPDEEVAQRLGRTLDSVKLRRCRRGIPLPHPKFRAWEPEHERLLGTVADEEVARLTGHTLGSVRARRSILYARRHVTARVEFRPSLHGARLFGSLLLRKCEVQTESVNSRNRHLLDHSSSS